MSLPFVPCRSTWSESCPISLPAAPGRGLADVLAARLTAPDLDYPCEGLHRRLNKDATKRFCFACDPCATERLRAYRAERNRILGAGRCDAFFLLENGDRPTDCTARYNFAVVCQRIGLRERQVFNKDCRGPRIHDVRHTFAVRKIMDWYPHGLDPDREMLKLTGLDGRSVRRLIPLGFLAPRIIEAIAEGRQPRPI